MNSDALALKNGTFASPAVARASSVLPVPGAPTSSTPFGARAPQTAILFRVFQEVDDLVDLRFHLIDAGDIVERHADRLWIDAILAVALQQSTQRSLLAPEHPDVEADEQENRTE